MRLDRFRISNFKGFIDREFVLHPEFNLVVGENGTGKTTLLEALSVAAGSWLLGISGYDKRHLRNDDVRLVGFETADGVKWEQQFPCVVEGAGLLLGETISWKRSLSSAQGRTTTGDARAVKSLGAAAADAVRRGDGLTLPLIAYYGTGRLWNVPREQSRVKDPSSFKSGAALSRLEAYRNCVDPRVSVPALVEWIARESWRTFQKQGSMGPTFRVARDALIRAVVGATDVYFDAEYGEVVVHFTDGSRRPFHGLSDGQRTMLALVGDLARRAATLNPHLGGAALAETPGLVLIDELDLHLHPTWQRRVIEDLRALFPAVQFVCTTHSPFLIQSLRSGEELLVLDGQPLASLFDMPIDAIARGIQGVDHPEVSLRYEAMKGVARSYLKTLDEAASAPRAVLESYLNRLSDSVAPYADNPAFQAFLEMKRAAKLGV